MPPIERVGGGTEGLVTEDKPRFRVDRVLGYEDETPPDAPEADGPGADVEEQAVPDPPAKPKRKVLDDSLTRTRERVIGRDGRLGVGILVASLFLFLAVFAFAWFQIGGESVDRAQAQQSVLDRDVGYLARLASMPVWGLTFTMAGGLALIVADVTATTKARHIAGRLAGGGLAGYGAFLCLLAAARLFGYWIGEVLDTGSASFSLHVLPYALLVGALAILTVGLVTLRSALGALRRAGPEGTWEWDRVQRMAGTTAAAAMALLLLLPLVPLASSFDDFDDERHLTEPEIYWEARAFGIGDQGMQKAADDLDVVHTVVWLSIGVCGLVFAAAVIGRLGVAQMAARLVVQAFLINSILWVILLVSTLALYFSHIPDIQVGFFSSDNYVPAFNHFLPIFLVVLAVLIVRFFLTVGLPFLRQARTSFQEDTSQDAS